MQSGGATRKLAYLYASRYAVPAANQTFDYLLRPRSRQLVRRHEQQSRGVVLGERGSGGSRRSSGHGSSSSRSGRIKS
jgi:hypothetical protein